MVKTAWDRDEVSFMFVAATVLQTSETDRQPGPGRTPVFVFDLQGRRTPSHLALFPASISSWMSLKPVTASLDRSST